MSHRPPTDLASRLDPTENQVLLAQFNLWAEEVGDDFEAEHATLFYMINRDDLAARRFDAASMEYDFNG